MENVTIDVSQEAAAAFSISGSAEVYLTLNRENTLKGGANFAGLQVPEGTAVVITKSSGGTVNATSKYGARICGGEGANSGTFTTGADGKSYSTAAPIGDGAGRYTVYYTRCWETANTTMWRQVL